MDDIVNSNVLADGFLQINNHIVIDFNNGILNPGIQILSNLAKSKKYHFAVYDIYFKQKLVGTIAIK